MNETMEELFGDIQTESEKIEVREVAEEIKTTKELYELRIKPTYKMFYSENSDYGIFSVEINKDTEDSPEIELNDYGNFVIKGNMPLLDPEKSYFIRVKSEISIDKQGRKAYEVTSLYEDMPTTKDDQVVFLKAILTEKQVEEIFKVYKDEDVLDLISNDKFDYSKVKGLGDVNYKKVKEKVLQNLEYREAIIRLSERYGMTHTMIKKMSDHYDSPTLLLQKIQEDPYILSYEVSGIGFKKADMIALGEGIPNDSPKRISACILYVLDEEANNGNAWVSRNKLSARVSKELNLRMGLIRDFLDEIPTNAKINRRVYIDESRLALSVNKKAEDEIAYHTKRILSIEDNYHITNIEAKIEQAEEEQGFDFTDEQREAIALAVRKNIIIINGKAGTGKTSVLKGILKVLSAQEGLSYATCALSGKAAQRIEESTGLDSSTMHRLLGYNPNGGFTFDEHNTLPHDVIVLDEASMVNSYLMSKLISAVKDGGKLIILGDTAQLEPIGVGNFLLDMINSKAVPRVELTIVHRQAQKSGILSIANKIREGMQFAKKNNYSNRKLGELEDLIFYPYQEKEHVFDAVVNLAKRFKGGNILDFQVITPLKTRGNLSAKSLNTALQDIFNPDEIGKTSIKKGDTVFRHGDKVIQSGNNYDYMVFNGTIGIIEFIDMTKGIMVINFEGVGRVEYKKDDLHQIDLAYALTIHRTQGSQWKYVIMALDYSSFKLLSRQILYTGLTRASDYAFLIVELDAMIHAIRTDNSTKRDTFLEEFLIESIIN